jgi:prepilin-type N-terminal cleavage/methylation domain-containing protein
MTLAPSDPSISPRNRQSGFTLLEALVSLALVALIASGVLRQSGWAGTQQRDRLDRLILTEFARSVLDEYRVTYPSMASTGTFEGAWRWAVTETPATDIEPKIPNLGYLELQATVWNEELPDRKISLTTLLARRLP